MSKILTEVSVNRFATFISSIGQPALVSIPTFFIINFFLMQNNYLFITTICIMFGALIPIITTIFFIKTMKTDLDITDRTKRTIPLLFAVLSYLTGFFVLWILNAPAITTVLMFVYATNTFIVIIINLSWKISIHAMGIAGPTAALMYTFGLPGALFGAIIPMVMWSRVRLNKHTIAQVIAGALLGLFITTLQMYYLVPLFDYK